MQQQQKQQALQGLCKDPCSLASTLPFPHPRPHAFPLCIKAACIALVPCTLVLKIANMLRRITGKKTNPHLVRDSIVTYLRSTGASERELEALAIYMGHSLEMQRGTYDR